MPHNKVEAVDALEALVKWDGDVTLAAADLATSPNMVMAAIVGNETSHDLMAKYLRAYTMAKTFGLINDLTEAVSEAIEEMPAKDAAKTLTSLIDGMARLTDRAQTAAPDPFAAVMRSLPPKVREAMAVIVQQHAAPDEVLETETDADVA